MLLEKVHHELFVVIAGISASIVNLNDYKCKNYIIPTTTVPLNITYFIVFLCNFFHYSAFFVFQGRGALITLYYSKNGISK